jgi:hypothetical protein
MVRARIRMFGDRMVILLGTPRRLRAIPRKAAAACPPKGCGDDVPGSFDAHLGALTSGTARLLLEKSSTPIVLRPA